ncbi:tyrosine-type recombinase/integrase [Halobacterium sp. PCN9]|uniref:Tyrosine-type recombinase/integrase n=2 Tax=Halobacterium bonnevillei TaxID=2692200 RepID=A0A6B0SD96_9EURY|nr:tyrosine-type recombinase/integrase [Halobacterium bonnevillei]
MSRQMKPERAVERYLKERKPEVSESTHYNHACTLNAFLEFCEEEELDNICDLDGFHIHDFKIFRREVGGINEVTLYKNLCTLRVFLKWCRSMDLVESGVVENMILPEPDDDARDTKIDAERADQILDYLERFEYATLRHALFALLWDTGFRIGTARAIDVDDYHPEGQYVEIRHRPEQDTPLKNGNRAEREVNLHPWVCEVLDDYIQIHREDTTDEYGREPLFSSSRGRTVRSNLRMHINRLTRPCHTTGDCPHGREKSECEAAQRYDMASKCPSSVSPHPIRRGSITHWLNEGHSKELLADRMNVSVKTLEKHYDARTEREKRELRREDFGME